MPVSERDPLIGHAKEKSSSFLAENPIVGEVSGVSYIDRKFYDVHVTKNYA